MVIESQSAVSRKACGIRGSGSVWIKIVILAAVFQAVEVVACSQDLLKNACIREPGISSLFHREAPASEIQDAALCNSGRSSPPLFCVSKPLGQLKNRQTDRETFLIFHLPSVLDGYGEDR